MLQQQYKQILVPVDGSYEAELAFKKGVAVAIRNNASLHLVHVVDTRAFQNISSFDTSMVEQVTDTAKETLDKYIEDAKKAGLNDVDYSISTVHQDRHCQRHSTKSQHRFNYDRCNWFECR